MTWRAALLVVAVPMAAAAPAQAQSRDTVDRGYISVNGGLIVTPSTFEESLRLIEFAEPALISTSYRVTEMPEIEVAAGVRVGRRNLALGVAVSRIDKAGTGSVQGQIPHPFFFNRPRSISGDAQGLRRDETAVHVQLRWMRPPTPARRWEIDLFAGPSVFFVGQKLVQDVTIAQSYPYDTATYVGVTSDRRQRAAIGFNAGGEVMRPVARHVGVSISAGFSFAQPKLSSADGREVPVSAGGVHVNAGIRFRL